MSKLTDTQPGTEFLEQTRRQFESTLGSYLPSEEIEPRTLHAAMRYAVLAGGKRIRPLLAASAFQFSGGREAHHADRLYPAMASLEILHTYSLIHDDLPCMDDDDLRRGQPTVHKKFGEAIAVLAGDALHVIAFRLMAQTGSLPAVLELADAVGTHGMIGGQVADLLAKGKSVDESGVKFIHDRKTGALIRASVVIGGLLAGASASHLEVLRNFGERVGLAFQIVDDILDIEGDETLLGKPVGSDLKYAKATYPQAIGIAASERVARALIDEAIGLVSVYDSGQSGPNQLVELARFVGKRAH